MVPRIAIRAGFSLGLNDLQTVDNACKSVDRGMMINTVKLL
jgi:hypothetical protein